MKITIKTLTNESIEIEIEPNDTIKKVKEKIQEIKGFQIFQQILILGGQLLEDNETLSYYYIEEGTVLQLALKKKVYFDDNLKDVMIKFFEEDIKQIEVSKYIKSNLKENELNVNLIHFDLNISSQENYKYYNKFNINVIGDFKAIDDLSILVEYLNKLKYKNIPYVVISSGSSGNDVISICYKYQFIKEIIIFCRNYKHNEHYIKEYPGYVNKVLISGKQLNEYIKTLGDEYKDGIQKYMQETKDIFSSINNIQQQIPIISSYEYDQYYFLVHKIYSNFFEDINNKNDNSLFTQGNLIKINEFLSQLNFKNQNEKNEFIDIFNKLAKLETNNQFIEQSLREYTNQSNFYHLFNRPLKYYGKGLISFSYFMGPFLYGLNKYVRDNPKFAMTKKMELFKIIKCSRLEFYQYKLNLGHIICLTSLVSTSSSEINYKSKENDNNLIEVDNDTMIVKLKFKYIHKKGNISPGIVIEDKKLNDGSYLSIKPKANEVILFPFTFAKIYDISTKTENKTKINIVKFELLNRNSYIEYILKNDFNKRILFFPLEGK